MPICRRITSQAGFDAMKDNSSNRLLVFLSDNSNPGRVDQYESVALDTAIEMGESIEIFCINIDHLELSPDDVDTYQDGVNVICLTTVGADGQVRDKRVAPSQSDVRQMILDLFL